MITRYSEGYGTEVTCDCVCSVESNLQVSEDFILVLPLFLQAAVVLFQHVRHT